jgi:hypothetical protein
VRYALISDLHAKLTATVGIPADIGRRPALAGGLWRGHWIYWVAPVTAMAAAVRTYELPRHTQAPRVDAGAKLGVQGPIATGTSSQS